MEVSTKAFIKGTIKTRFRTEIHESGGLFNLWIYPALFCVALFINDPRYMGPNAPIKEQIAAIQNAYRHANVYVDEQRNVRSSTEHVRPEFVRITSSHVLHC